MRKLFLAAALAAALSFSAFAGPPQIIVPPAAKSVTTSALLLTATNRHVFVRIYNNDASKTLYVGMSSAVTTATGFPVAPGSYIDFGPDLAPGQDFYGIGTSGTTDARVLEVAQQ